MPEVVRKGDKNTAGGRALSGDQSFLIDGRPTVVIGTPVSPHPPCPLDPSHCHAKTAVGSKSFFLNGKPVNIKGNPDTCGHPRNEGSTTFMVGD